MNRLVKCINFQLKSMTKSTVIFLCVYIASSLALFMLFQCSVSVGSNSNSSISSGFYIGGAIFAFVYTIANYKTTFNYLLMFGNNRKNIFLSSVITFVVMSVLLAAVSMLSLLIEGALSKALQFNASGSLISLIYGGANTASEFLWFATFFIMICSFSMLYSSLAYKFGNVFITVFWVGFGISWFVLPVLLSFSRMPTFIALINAYFCIGNPNGILLAPVNFLITTVIFSTITYIISSRQSQVA